MRIVQLITRFIVGGAQRIALDTAIELCRQSHDCEIWCGPQTGPEGSLAEEAAAHKLTVRTVPDLVKEVDPLRDLRALRWLTRELRLARPELVHTHSSKAGILGRRAAHTAGVERIVHTVHGWGFSDSTARLPRTAFISAEKAAARWCRALIAVSGVTRDLGLRAGIGSAEQYRVIRPGIETAPYSDLAGLRLRGRRLRAELGIDETTPLAGTVGRLADQKNPFTFLDLAERIDRLDWLLVGDGPLRESLESEIERRRLGLRVHLAGLRSDVAACLGSLDLFCLVSQWEGLPLTVLEAGAAAVPVVAADVGGVAEVMAAPPAGWIVPPGDLDATVRAIGDWMAVRGEAEPALLEQRERVLADHSRHRMLASILNLYDEPPSRERLQRPDGL